MSEELIAYLADRRAGRLIRKDSGNLQFRYDDDYAGPPLSLAMPVQAEAHPHAVCRAVFGGLLPEGDGREALARALGLSPGNDYGLLAEVGGDCAGAITLLRAGRHDRRTSPAPGRSPTSSSTWSCARCRSARSEPPPTKACGSRSPARSRSCRS